MKKVKIFTPSSIDLLPVQAEEFDIGVVPDIIIFDDQEYINNVTIDAATFYSMLRSYPALPTTAHPSIGMFMEAFRNAGDYEAIICINVTSEMSGTHNSTNIAKEMLEEDGFVTPIHTFDSGVVSYGMAIFAIEAARMANEGKSAAEILSHLEDLKGHIGVYFVMRSLKMARKMRRVFFLKAQIADALNIKPVLTFDHGVVSDIGTVHGFDEAMQEIVKQYREKALRGGEMFVFHANNEQDANRMAAMIYEIDPAVSIRIEWVGPALGVFTGEGAVGIAFKEKY